MEHTLIRLQVNDKEILLVPTAHVSKESAEYVRKVIDEEQPDCICIELDEDRYQSVTSKKKWEDTSLVDVIRQKKVGYLLVNLILGHYQKKLA
ncbi:MAG: TraB/GumN family protein, partial [Erysipelotrichaceae bacterium]|nr:TraB/GumN family protein [Erysipelotrichaceae bacterium]